MRMSCRLAVIALGCCISDVTLGKVWSSRRFAVSPVLGLLVGASAILLALVPDHPIAILAWLSLGMAAVGLTEGSYWAASVQIGGTHAGTAAGILNTGGNGIGLLAPILTPYLSDLIGWKKALAVAAVVSLLAAVLWLPVRLEPADGETSPPPA